MNVNLHFILGIGRSGTTVLSNELNKISGVLAAPEMVFLIFFLKKFEKKSICKSDLILMIEQIKTYSLSHPWVDWKFDESYLIESFEDSLKKGTVDFRSTCLMIYKSFSNGQNNKNTDTIIDKNPSYTLFAKQICKFSPSSKFIFLTRDYRANILSRKQSVYLKSDNLVYNAIRWRIFNRKTLHFARNNKEKAFSITYEKFLENTESIIDELLAFLSIANVKKPQSGTEGFQADSFSIPQQYQKRYTKKYSDLSRPINPSRKEAWKDQLSEKEIFLCDLFCGKVGNQLGYLAKHEINIGQKITYHIRYLLPVFRAYVDIYKDYIIYYLHPKLKLKILRKRYKKLGFNNK